MNPTKYTPAHLHKYARTKLRRPAAWAARRLPRWVWPTIEVSALATAGLMLVVGLVAVWQVLAGLGVPWWAGIIATGFPAGALTRLAKEARRWRDAYCNWRDHTLDQLADVDQPAGPERRVVVLTEDTRPQLTATPDDPTHRALRLVLEHGRRSVNTATPDSAEAREATADPAEPAGGGDRS